jgi:hypothetical protein
VDVLEKKEKPKEEKPVVAQPEPKPDLECSPDVKPNGQRLIAVGERTA